MTTIKSVRGDLIVKTDGLDVMSMLTKKSDLQQAIATSEAHKWLIDYASSKGKNKITGSNQIPSTETQSFVLKSFYTSVKMVVENLVELEGESAELAIHLGNSLILGNPIVGDNKVIMSQISDALRYGRQAGVF